MLAGRAADLGVLPGACSLIGGGNGDDELGTGDGLDSLGQILREGEVRLEGACGQVLGVVELPGVGDPLVDEDQARGVRGEHVLQGGTRVGTCAVGIGYQVVPCPAAQLPGKLTPQRVDLRTVGLDIGLSRAERGAHQHDATNRFGRKPARMGINEFVHFLRKPLRLQTRAEQVVKGEHRVSLAATEIGLQVDRRRRVEITRDSAQRLAQQVLQPHREIGALEELHRVGVLRSALALSDLGEVRGELRGVEIAAGHVRVRDEHLPPRLQPLSGHTGRRRDVTCGSARLGLDHGTLMLQTGAAYLVHQVLVRADGREQSLGGVQGAARVIGVERGVMRPVVADVVQLSDVVAGRRRQRVPEIGGPIPEDHLHEELRILLGQDHKAPVTGVRHRVVEPALTLPPGHLPLDQGEQPLRQQFDHTTDPVAVTHRHSVVLPVVFVVSPHAARPSRAAHPSLARVRTTGPPRRPRRCRTPTNSASVPRPAVRRRVPPSAGPARSSPGC